MTELTTSIWDRQEVVDALDEIVQTNSDRDLIFSNIPSLFGVSDKATYLGFRAVGLTTLQALEVTNKTPEDLERWQVETPELIEFEAKHMAELQRKVGAEIVRLGFLRNMTMFLFKDQLVVRKMLTNMEEMTSREFAYGKVARRFYSTHDLLALEKAIAPENHKDTTLVLSFNNNVYEIQEGDPDKMQYLPKGSEED